MTLRHDLGCPTGVDPGAVDPVVFCSRPRRGRFLSPCSDAALHARFTEATGFQLNICPVPTASKALMMCSILGRLVFSGQVTATTSNRAAHSSRSCRLRNAMPPNATIVVASGHLPLRPGAPRHGTCGF